MVTELSPEGRSYIQFVAKMTHEEIVRYPAQLFTAGWRMGYRRGLADAAQGVPPLPERPNPTFEEVFKDKPTTGRTRTKREAKVEES